MFRTALILAVVPFSAVLTLFFSPATPGSWSLLRQHASIPAPRASDKTIFAGTVRDAETGKSIANVQVRLEGRADGALTDERGRYQFGSLGIQAGTVVTISARRIGYQSVTTKVTVRSDTVRTDVKLSASSQTLASVAVQGAYAPGIGKGIGRGTGYTEIRPRVRQPGTRDRGSMDSSVGGATANREQYDRIEDNPFLAVSGNPRSTFSIDVDRAAYGNMRRMISTGSAVVPDAVRIEELINYFPYSLPAPAKDVPIAVTTEVAPAPWQPKHQLLRIALKARDIETAKLPPNNLVFLIDVSGSMMSADKLPLVKSSLRLLVDQLREEDRVAIVAYAGAAGLVLPSTSGEEKARIAAAIDRLEAGGSTAGGAGIMLAYKVAMENFVLEGNNRVVLATDGDFNVGASSDGEMERLIEEKRKEGTYLTVLGFGTGNLQDAKMEKLARKGNGNYAYVDNIAEARKTLVHEMGATLLTVANDVKLQVEFNPAAVQSYRLIGYEDRLLRDEDFTDDRKDAGDVGAGHSVTALYEIVPVGVTGTTSVNGSDPLRYVDARPARTTTAGSERGGELLFVKVRYKRPGDSTSRLITHPVMRDNRSALSEDFRFAASVAAFGMLLRNSEHRGNTTAQLVAEMARGSVGRDAGGYRSEFVKLVEQWRARKVAMEDR